MPLTQNFILRLYLLYCYTSSCSIILVFAQIERDSSGLLEKKEIASYKCLFLYIQIVCANIWKNSANFLTLSGLTNWPCQCNNPCQQKRTYLLGKELIFWEKNLFTGTPPVFKNLFAANPPPWKYIFDRTLFCKYPDHLAI